MYTVLQTAAYIFNKYNVEHGQPIDEMRLHKYLYLAQRESFIMYDEPLFDGNLEAWKFGPVSPIVRYAYDSNNIIKYLCTSYNDKFTQVINNVFERYSHNSSWALSGITHSETSWINARMDLADGENGNTLMSLDDIKVDAESEKCKRAAEMLRKAAEYERINQPMLLDDIKLDANREANNRLRDTLWEVLANGKFAY